MALRHEVAAAVHYDGAKRRLGNVIPRFTLGNHVIPAKAGIHRVSDQQWTPAFAGVTTHVIFIPLGGSKTHDHSE